MVYCGIKRDVHFAGWMMSPHTLRSIRRSSPNSIQVMQQARADSLIAIAGIREGRIDPKPADEMKCDFCDYANACRYEVAAMEQAKKAGK